MYDRVDGDRKWLEKQRIETGSKVPPYEPPSRKHDDAMISLRDFKKELIHKMIKEEHGVADRVVVREYI